MSVSARGDFACKSLRLTPTRRVLASAAMRTLALVFSLSIAACVQTTDARIGTPHAARPDDCQLRVIDQNDTSNFAVYEQVGVVRVQNAPAGTSPLDPSIRSIVRPRACRLGGEAVSILASGDAYAGFSKQGYASYVVWARKTASAANTQF